MSFSGGEALSLQRIIYGPSIGTAQRVDQTLPGNPCVDPGNAGPILLALQAASRCRDRTPAAHRTRRETTLCRGVAIAEGTPTETRIDGLFAPEAEREPDSALLELARHRRRDAPAPGFRGIQSGHDPRDCRRLPTDLDDLGPRGPGPRDGRRGAADAGRRGRNVSAATRDDQDRRRAEDGPA